MTASPPPVIVWFRQDLRLADNPALAAAAETGAPVIALYILDLTPGVRPLGAAGRWWLERSLSALARSLRDAGAPLILRRGRAREVLQDLVDETSATRVFWNRLYDPGAAERDAALEAALEPLGAACATFNASLLVEPREVASAAGAPFRVFTPFWRRAGPIALVRSPAAAPKRLRAPESPPRSDRVADWRLYPGKPDWAASFADWSPGEAGALARLERFMAEGLAGYRRLRHRPDLPGTSRLSPHLRFGEIGPRQVLARIGSSAERGAAHEEDAEAFASELGWREFNHHLLFHWPETAGRSFDPLFDALPWRRDEAGLDAWRRGRTGYPLVDAGMRELWSTGWMHNRVRMVAASFLVKHLLVDWREGEAWFWDTLLDADAANNAGGWQWVAGGGADAAPYFRIFSPVRQGATYDPGGDYVRRWIPELAGLPAAHIHSPWLAQPDVLGEAGVRLGSTYPAPIVDHETARERALAAFRALRG